MTEDINHFFIIVSEAEQRLTMKKNGSAREDGTTGEATVSRSPCIPHQEDRKESQTLNISEPTPADPFSPASLCILKQCH